MRKQLSQGAALILSETLDVLQNAEELGGVDDTEDYVLLMTIVIAECQKRIQGASTHPEESSNV